MLRIGGTIMLNDENKYEPYDYGKNLSSESENQVEEHEVQIDLGGEESESANVYDYGYQNEPTNNQPSPKPGKPFFKIFGILLLVIILGSILVIGVRDEDSLLHKLTENKGNAQSNELNQTPNSNESDTLESTQISQGSGELVVSNVADVAEQVMPSVVSITSMSSQEVQMFPFGGVQEYEVPSSGSGIIIGQNKQDVLIVTNNHVVENSKTLTVIWNDGTSTDATIRGTDKDKDLAIITVPFSSLKKSTREAIKVATIGDSKLLRVGEPAIAIGNALGYGQSVTLGIVSAVSRTLEGSEGVWIQTDAAINPGNSGGALVNAKGEVIGINTAKVSADAVEGMGYAIPISDVTDVLEELMNQEARVKVPEEERGSLGIRGVDVPSDIASWYNMPVGIYINDVEKGSGADKAGLPVYSVITEINGRDVKNLEELVEELSYYRAGETVTVTCSVQVSSKYEEQEFKVKLK